MLRMSSQTTSNWWIQASQVQLDHSWLNPKQLILALNQIFSTIVSTNRFGQACEVHQDEKYHMKSWLYCPSIYTKPTSGVGVTFPTCLNLDFSPRFPRLTFPDLLPWCNLAQGWSVPATPQQNDYILPLPSCRFFSVRPACSLLSKAFQGLNITWSSTHGAWQTKSNLYCSL